MNLLFASITLSILASSVHCQNYDIYTNRTVFTCNNRNVIELIELTTRCGNLLSPCYPMNYTLDSAEGHLIWRVNPATPAMPVAGFRLTFNDFSTNDVGGILYVGQTFNEQTTNLVFPTRTLTFYGSISLSINEDMANLETLAIGDTYDVDFNIIHASFYSSTTLVRDRGFNVSYCADYDQCATGLCLNGATCVRNGFEDYLCQCPDGYDGLRCENDIDECATNTDNCIPEPNAVCSNTPVGSFTCTCAAGFTGDGVTSCNDINECTSGLSNCHADATCIDNTPGFSCVCNSGYTGNGTSCTDIDECLTDNGGCGDVSTSTCTNDAGTFICGCLTGYSSTAPGTVPCANINECTTGTDNCATTATCTDTVGSFECNCNAGYTGDGVTCSDIDECALGTDTCDFGATCGNTVGSFTCTCATGFTGDGITACNNIDECAMNTDNCDGNATCVDNDGSFACTCNTGYNGDGESCIDINECAVNNGECGTTNTSTCANSDGSFMCGCVAGYTSTDPGVIACTDIDECALGTDNCADGIATCTNTDGSFTCACNVGYTGDGMTCTDVNECDVPGTCNDVIQPSGFAQERCENIAGGFRCVCNNPHYRSLDNLPPCQGFYCAGNPTTLTTCTVNGILEWPIPWDGTTNYQINQEINWLINITDTTGGTGAIRFIFRQVEVEASQDYIIFSTSADINDISAHQAVITGSTETGLISGQNTSAIGNLADFTAGTGGNPSTYIINANFIYVHFHSDRDNTFTGFVIDYEEDSDDCATITCENSGVCADRSFTYECENCATGFTGMDCATDVLECTIGNDTCSDNATCTEVVGSFNCSCNAGYTGNGTTCYPFIVVSNLVAQPEGDNLRITFDISSPFGTDRTYFEFHQLLFNNTATGAMFTINTPAVNASDFQSFLITNADLPAANTYTMLFLFGSQLMVIGNEAMTSIETAIPEIVMPDTLPLAPTNLNRGTTVDNVRYDITWTAPDPTDRGTTIAYEVSAQRTAADCARFVNVGSQDDCTAPRLIRFEADAFPTSYSIVGLLQFRRYNIMLRAQTTAGFGSFSTVFGPQFTGIECPSYLNNETQIACSFRESAFTTPLFPAEYPRFQEIYWLFDFSGQGAIRFVFEFFEVELNQDYLDLDEGNISALTFPTPGDFTYTGTLTGREPLVIEQTSTNNGLVTARFASDLYNFTIPGFQMLVQTNESRCSPNPCLQGGTCVREAFDFSCDCPTIYGGPICSLQRVTVNVTCVVTGETSFRVDWTVPSEFANDPEVINNYTISYNRIGGTVMTATSGLGTSSLDVGSIPGFTEFTATVRVNVVREAIITLDGTCGGVTNQGTPSPPLNVAATATSTSAIQVSWDAPSMPVGVIESYTVTYYPTSDSTDTNAVTTTNTMVEVTGLGTYEEYRFVVTATNGAPQTSAGADATARTSEGVPVSTVTGVMFTPASDSTAISFTPPAEVTGVFSYIVTVTSAGGVTNTYTATSSPFTIPSLIPATDYNITVTAQTSAGSGPEYSGMFTTLDGIPGVVNNLAASAATSTSVLATWDPPTVTNGVITGYTVTWSLGGSEVGSMSTTATMYTIPSLEVYTDYLISVFASTSAGNGSEVSTMGRSGEGAPSGPVLNLAISSVTANGATLAFQPPTVITGVFNFIAVATPIMSTNPIISTNGPASPLQLTGLEPFTDYSVEVYAATSAPDRGPGVNQTIQTLEAVPGEAGTIMAAAVDMTSLNLQWAPPTPATGVITQYRVSWWANGVLVGMQNVTTNSITLTGLEIYTDYTVMVRSSTAIGEGPPSVITIRTAEGVPTDAVRDPIFFQDMTSFNVTFQPPVTTVGVYTYRVIVLQGGVAIQNFTTTSTTTSVTGLEAGTDYEVSIIPSTSAGVGPSLTQSVRTIQVVPDAVSDLEQGSATADSVALSWTESAEIMGTIYYIITWTPATGSGTFMTTNTSATITSLEPFVNYTFVVVATSDGGSSEPQVINVQTGEAEPGPVLGLTGTTGSDNRVTINYEAPSPVRGTITGYRIQYMQNLTECAELGDPNCTNSSIEPILTTDLTYTTEDSLRPYRTFIFTVTAITSVGDGPVTTIFVRTNVGIPLAIASASVEEISGSSTSIRINFAVTTPVPGPSNFTVSLTPVVAEGSVVSEILNENSVAISQTIVIENLITGLGYRVDIGQTTTAGITITNSATIVYRECDCEVSWGLLTAPVVVPNAAPETPTVPISLEGNSPTTSNVIENPCNRANQLFEQRGGPTTAIQIIVVGAGGDVLTGTTSEFYANVFNLDPINAYVAAEVICSTGTSGRKKRQVTANGEGFILGADNTCDPNSPAICNGPLRPDTTYMVAFRGMNDGGQISDPTEYGGEFTTDPVTGLSPGEIAAIVICSFIVLLLIIVLIVFCVRRRRSRKETISGGGRSNKGFEEKQKYEVDTSYTEQSSRPPGAI